MSIDSANLCRTAKIPGKIGFGSLASFFIGLVAQCKNAHWACLGTWDFALTGADDMFT